MIQQLAVIDESGAQIGMTFPKRARQLINKQRALWKDETHTAICLLPELKEENVLNNSFKDETDYTKSDDMLLYLAKKRVSERRKYKKHALACISAWVVLGILYGFMFVNVQNPMYGHLSSVAWQLDNEVMPLLVGYGYEGNAIGVINEASWIINRDIYDYTTPIFYVIEGMMAAWSIWIAAYFIKSAVEKANGRHTRKLRPDPIALEYQRLKDMSSEGFELGRI